MIRRRLCCQGVVQGVGFRPSVYRLARSLDLAGSVLNDADGATIDVEGQAEQVAAFADRLATSLPPLARLDHVDISEVAPVRADSFRIEESALENRRRALLPPDAALCPACRRDMEDTADRRHQHPFTTCMACGPRFTIVRTLPYDRERTSMQPFRMCVDCAREYDDPTDRRFHTESVCCPACAPRLWLARGDGSPLGDDDALARARQILEGGGRLAVKGVGGFQLVCRADDAAAVSMLRAAKQREHKPFALMARDLATARRLVRLTPADEALLSSPRAPILLAPARPEPPVADNVAPGIADLGVMLPTTPLHVELLRGASYDVLVATSGNRHDEPICRTNDEAVQQLGALCDALLLHDREIVRRADDSVARTGAAGARLVRRSRGWVPGPMALPVETPLPVLALGGQLQTTACLAVEDQAFLSQHVGDLDTEAARAFLLEVALGLEDFLQRQAAVVAVDLHPDLASTAMGEGLASERGARLLRVQHHLAHAAAVLAEHGQFPEQGRRAAALVLDGTGLGTDGNAWGCEWLTLSGNLHWRRLAHAEGLPLVGGERAIREPWRVACAALADGVDLPLLLSSPLASTIPPFELERMAELARHPGWPLATGAGRLFEAAGALLGLCPVNEYEGQAAARLEAIASREDEIVAPWPEVCLAPDDTLLPSSRLLAAAAHRQAHGETVSRVASGFHASFCRLAAELTRRVLPPGIDSVALGGGCLVNRHLVDGLSAEFARQGLVTLVPREVPPGDGGLAYGQAVVAAVASRRDCEPLQEGAA